MGPSFFGLPRTDDPEFAARCGRMNVDLLREIRYVAREVGYREARRMPVEVRRWWIEEMRKEGEAHEERVAELAGKRTRDV